MQQHDTTQQSTDQQLTQTAPTPRRADPMRYLMLVLTDPDAPEPPAGTVPDIEEWVATHDASGVRVAGERLEDPQAATGVRVRDGRLVVTDGPFAETKEQIAGFDIIEADDLDDAIAVAAGHPMAFQGALELRPFWSGGA